MWSFERKFGASFTPELTESWQALYATAQNEILRDWPASFVLRMAG
ncbi:hypothetical protein ACVILK_005300 [Bradyrhizobium embrapense]